MFPSFCCDRGTRGTCVVDKSVMSRYLSRKKNQDRIQVRWMHTIKYEENKEMTV